LYHRGRRPGFTLVEMLISVVLLAVLLTAIALAMRASLTAYRQNDNSAVLTQTTRALLMRIGREIRTSEAVNYEADDNQLIILPPDNEAGLEQIKYDYDSGAKTLYYDQTIHGSTTRYVLADRSSPVQVSSFSTRYEVVQNPQQQYIARRVVVTLGLEMGGQTTTFVCSASPRRNLEF
jgi:prepilin-type N-terminal cleavage/methylation domain-containing protein